MSAKNKNRRTGFCLGVNVCLAWRGDFFFHFSTGPAVASMQTRHEEALPSGARFRRRLEPKKRGERMLPPGLLADDPEHSGSGAGATVWPQ